MLKSATQILPLLVLPALSIKSSGSHGHELGLKIILLNIKRILSSLLLYASRFFSHCFFPNHGTMHFFSREKDEFLVHLQSSVTCTCRKTTGDYHKALVNKHECFLSFLTNKECIYQSSYCINLRIFILYPYIFIFFRLLPQ